MSRSSRVRKKSSKFADFESPDEIDTGMYKKKNLPIKPNQKIPPPKIDESESDDSESEDTESDGEMKDDSLNFSEDWGENIDPVDILDDLREEEEFDNEDSLQVDDENSTASKDDSNYSQAQSLYFSEKKKGPGGKDGLSVKRKKTERKDKGKARCTAYMLYARAMRPKIVEENPLMDFSAVNKRLGEMWSLVPYTQKHNWRRKAKKLEAREEKPRAGNVMISTGKAPKSSSSSSSSSSNKSNLIPKGKIQAMYGNKAMGKGQGKPLPLSQNTSLNAQKSGYHTPKNMKLTMPTPYLDTSPTAPFKVTGTSPIDVAAHLKLLGESLNNIGQKLKEHEGQIAVSGSLSVLLDSMLCVLGPLICLSNQLEETQGAIPEQTLSNILDNIAYIMPGIV